MNKTILTAAAVLGILFLTSCGKIGPDVPYSVPDSVPSADPAPAGGSSPLGIWYEQAENAARIEITEKSLVYYSGHSDYSSTTSYQLKKENNLLRLETEDFFTYEDIYYDQNEDMLICYTLSHTDGDGGHHREEFRRTEYTPPPAPVYGPPVDRSDPDAKKDFEDLTIRSMEVSFYDEGEPYDIDSDMAMQPPYADDYSYSLTVEDDGTAKVSSSFCQEIELSKEIVDELQELARQADLGQINGVDIHTEDLPYGSPEYEAVIELASGDIIRSSANGENVPAEWKNFQEPMHRLLFFAFVDAGYKLSGEFHSTKPMRRIGAAETLFRENSGFTQENVLIVPDWKKSYEYSLDTKYFKFRNTSNAHPELMKTLESLSEQYKKLAEEGVKKDYQTMEAVPKSVWKKAARLYCYSFYSVEHWSLSGNIFNFMVSEGHANSLGAGEHGHGNYRYIRYNIDADTGKILSVSDLFKDTDSVYNALMEVFGNYGTHNDSGRFVHSDEFPAFLRAALEKPEPEGIGFNFTYDYLELWMPLGMYEGNDSQLREVLYYDEIQDILSETYSQIR